MTNSSEDQRFFRRAEAAEYLQNTYRIRCTTKTLANYASGGKGPSFHYAGRHPIYTKAELDKWARLHLGLLPTGPKVHHAESKII